MPFSLRPDALGAEADTEPAEVSASSDIYTDSVKGVRVCLTNNMDDLPNPYWRDREPTVKWYQADSTTGSGKLPIGSTFCAVGTGVSQNDLAFALSDFDRDPYFIEGFMNNPWIGYPEVVVRKGHFPTVLQAH